MLLFSHSIWSIKFLILCGYNFRLIKKGRHLSSNLIEKDDEVLSEYEALLTYIKWVHRQLTIHYRDRYRLWSLTGHYKIKRLAKGLPCRGQRTHTNAQTSRRLNKIRLRS